MRTLFVQRPYMEGADVRKVQKAVHVKVDGVYGPDTAAAVKQFQRHHHLDADGVVGPQTWAVIEGHKPPKSPNPSGLSASKRRAARKRTVQAAELGLKHAPAIHYTQGAQRWQGIDHRLLSREGRYPTQADCSSFATWCLWNGLYVPYHLHDIVNGEGWGAGYTGTLLSHGVSVGTPGELADLVLYGVRGTTGKHVAVYVGDGMVISHGSEGGPYFLRWDYRSDVQDARRYV